MSGMQSKIVSRSTRQGAEVLGLGGACVHTHRCFHVRVEVERVESRRPGVVALTGRRDELAHGVCPGGCTESEIRTNTNAATEDAWYLLLVELR